MKALTVEIVKCVDDELVSAFTRLVPQLSSLNPAPSQAQLDEIVSSSTTMLFVARLDDRLVGALTLALFRIPTGLRAWIEDVVVDNDVRRSGIGEALIRAALDEAKKCGAVTVDLTSRSSREAANLLYKRLGFVVRETNVYRFELARPDKTQNGETSK